MVNLREETHFLPCAVIDLEVTPQGKTGVVIQVEQNPLLCFWHQKLVIQVEQNWLLCFQHQKPVGSSKQSRTLFCVSGTKPGCGHLSGAKPTFVFPAPKTCVVIHVKQNPLVCFWHQPLVTWAYLYTCLWLCHKPRFLCR